MCMLGIAEALLRGSALEPWLALALAERFRDGLREYLKFAAGFAHVSIGIIAPEDRLDFACLQRECAEGERRLREQADLVFKGLGGPSIVLIAGRDKPFKTVLSEADYADVRRLGDEYRARVPRSVFV